MLTRRLLLMTGGAGVVLVGAGLGSVLHSDLRGARAPWRTAGKRFEDPRLNALSYAVLAPSPHNRQPWLVRLEAAADALTLFCDLDRLLPHTDPPNRQVVIGLGAFLELLRQAAAEEGYGLRITTFPEGEPWPVLDARPVASVKFVEAGGAPKDPLFDTILDRRTSRVRFDQKRPIANETLSLLDQVLRSEDGEFEWVNDPVNGEALKSLCREAWEIEMATQATHKESTALTRIGEKEINENPDGISLSGPVIESLSLVGVMNRIQMNDPSSRAYDEARKYYNSLIDSAMAFGWLSTAANSRRDQLRVGGGWVRLHQAATRAGLAMQPLSQPLQEFPEMAEKFEEIHDFTGFAVPTDETSGRVQGLFRFGYAKAPPPAPRWPMQTRIVRVDA
ncbi:MAG: twin-arginine translocation pathway signal protein [Pseudomonadota bacterium]